MIVSAQAQAADIYAGTFGSVRIQGDIVPGDAEKFERFTANYPTGTYITLMSHGGDMREAVLIGFTIHERGFDTVVTARADCLSACAIMFFSGHHAVVQRNSALCFHMPYSMITGQAMNYQQTEALTEVLMEWGITRQQALAVIGAAPPNGLRCATEAWATYLGFRYGIVPSFGTMWRSCAAKFCLAIP
jgi:hypothetical protein